MSKIVISLMVLISLLHSDIYKRGEKIFANVCESAKIKSLSYHDSDDLQHQIIEQKLCTNLNKKNLNALIAYITKEKKTSKEKISVPKKAKCPVCGMWVEKYPKWVAIIKTKDDVYFFDGVKDMMKFYFDPVKFHKQEMKIEDIIVTDYYALLQIKAKSAYFVVGSNIYGPMGEELIPFAKKSDAEIFLKEHSGKNILTFDKIKEKFLY